MNIRTILLGALLAIGALTVAESAWAQTPPPTRPTGPTPTPVCPNVSRTRLIVRERARVITDDGLNLRAGSNTTAEVIGQVDEEDIVYVLEGPVCSAIYAWYRVAYGDLEGWIAESGIEGYYVEVYPPG